MYKITSISSHIMTTRRTRSPRRSPLRNHRTSNVTARKKRRGPSPNRIRKKTEDPYEELKTAMISNDAVEVKYILDNWDVDLTKNNYELLVIGVGEGSIRALNTLTAHTQFKSDVNKDPHAARVAMASMIQLMNPDMPKKYKHHFDINPHNPYNPRGNGRRDFVKTAAILGTGVLLGSLLF